jgi:signal transduction histidine kinase
MGGVTLSVGLGLLIRQQIDLVAQLRQAQAGLAARARAEERNRIGRELHDVIAHTLTRNWCGPACAASFAPSSASTSSASAPTAAR